MYFNPPLLESLSMNGVQEIRLSLQESLGCHKAFARVESGSLVFFNGLHALVRKKMAVSS